MTEQLPYGYAKRFRCALFRLTGWVTGACLIASSVLVATNSKGWTHTALWVPPAIGGGVIAYIGGTILFLVWGAIRRSHGRIDLFWNGSRIGATPDNDYWLIHSFFAGMGCLAVGLLGRTDSMQVFVACIIPLFVPSILLFTASNMTKGFYRLIAANVGLPGFQLLGYVFWHSRHPFSFGSIALRAGVFVTGIAFLVAMLAWHARIAWRERETESKTT